MWSPCIIPCWTPLQGLTIANLIDPGSGLQLTEAEFDTGEAPNVVEVLLGIVPENPIGAMADGDVLPTIFFALVFGLALPIIRDESPDETVRERNQ